MRQKPGAWWFLWKNNNSETNEWEVYLTKGQWVHYWTNETYSGPGTITIDATIHDKSRLPLFVKAGSIIPMIEDMAYIHEKPSNTVNWDIYPSEKSSYTWYDKKSAHPGDEIKKVVVACQNSDGQVDTEVENPAYLYQSLGS